MMSNGVEHYHLFLLGKWSKAPKGKTWASDPRDPQTLGGYGFTVSCPCGHYGQETVNPHCYRF